MFKKYDISFYLFIFYAFIYIFIIIIIIIIWSFRKTLKFIYSKQDSGIVAPFSVLHIIKNKKKSDSAIFIYVILSLTHFSISEKIDLKDSLYYLVYATRKNMSEISDMTMLR